VQGLKALRLAHLNIERVWGAQHGKACGAEKLAI